MVNIIIQGVTGRVLSAYDVYKEILLCCDIKLIIVSLSRFFQLWT